MHHDEVSMRKAALVASVVLAILVMLTVAIAYNVYLSQSGKCGLIKGKLLRVLKLAINALNYTAPFNDCEGGCTYRFFYAYKLLSTNATELLKEASEAGCMGLYKAAPLIAYAVGNLTTYNPANPLLNIDIALNDTVIAYRLISS